MLYTNYYGVVHYSKRQLKAIGLAIWRALI